MISKKMSVGIVVGVTFIFDVFTLIFYSRVYFGVCVCVCWLRFILIFGIHFSCHLVRFHIFCLTCAVILSVFKLDPR